MKRKLGRSPFRTYAVAADGARKRIRAREIVVVLGRNRELLFDLAPHPNHGDVLPISGGPQPTSLSAIESSVFPHLVVHPGAMNTIHLSVERHRGRIVRRA